MKKIISLFLTVVMALSMFSCLSVTVGAATTDLVINQEYIVPSETTKIFVPEESGYYKFASNGYGDPKIQLQWSYNLMTFDDENGRDFNGVVELEAGEEVSCYLYNFSGADCVFTITKVDVPVSMSVDFAETIEIVENTEGYWYTDSGCDEEDSSKYYRYYTPEVYREGVTITLGYADGRNVVYPYNEGNFVNEYGDVLVFNYYAEQSYEKPWAIGSDNYIIFNVLGAECKVPVTIVENPIESIEFILHKPLALVENIEGYWDNYYNPETGESEDAFIYTNYDVQNEQNIFRVNYNDGRTVDYRYKYVLNEEYGWYDYKWCDEDGNVLPGGYIETVHNQYSKPWKLGSENYLDISYMGRKTQVPVSIIENPVESIEFIPSYSYRFMENTGGYFEDWYNSETKEWETVYFYDNYYIDDSDNVLRVNYTDGRTVDYVYSYKYDEDTDTSRSGWYDENGEKLPYGDVRSYDNQSTNPWKAGSDNYFTVKYLGKETQVPVTIFENPVESISVTLANPIEIVENCDGYMEEGWIWDETSGEDVWVEYYRYYTPYITREGNSVTVNYKDGTSDVFVFNDWNWEFENAEGESIRVETYSNQNYHNRWTLGSENYFTVELENYNVETQVPVTIIESPYESVEFIPVEPLVIEEYTHGYWEVDGEDRCFRYRPYKVVEKEGNVIRLTKKDGTIEIYTCSDFDYINEDGEYLVYYVDSNFDEWAVGENNILTITANGVSREYNITIIESTNVIFNNRFVAEKISDDSCIITSVDVDEDDFDGVLDIPEEIDGCKVIGIEDGVLSDVYRLREITLPSGFSMISENLFDDCYRLEKINVSDSNEVFKSVNGVLYNAALTEILYCPEAFTGDFIIKAGVTELPGEVVARLNKASSIEVESGNTAFAFEDGVLYDSAYEKLYIAISPDADFEMKSTVTEIFDYAFYGNKTIENVKFAPGVTEITYYSFADCTSLKSVELPSSLVSIGERAFSNDTSLSVLTLPASTKNIDSYAFTYCDSLAEINLNEGLESMGDSVFSSSAVEKIVLPDSLTSMGYGCFAYSPNLSDVTIGKGLTEIPSGTFSGCSSVKDIVIPKNITVLGGGSFSGTGLSTLPLHDKITDISGAFYNCNNLTEINIPDTVVYMNSSFSFCENLTRVYVGSGVRSMNGTFSGCENLEEINFAEGFDAEMEWAFSNCEKLTEIKFSSTVTEISYGQFAGCSNLAEIDIPDTLYKVGAASLHSTAWYDNQDDGEVYLEKVFYDFKGKMPDNYTLVIKDGTKSIADEAVTYYKNLVGVELPDGLKYIGLVAFEGCENLTDITIPESVEYIDNYAIGYKYGRTNDGYGYIKYGDVTIRGWSGSEAERYAEENGFTFVSVGHKHVAGDWIIDTDATCTVAGSKHNECTTCGETVETAVIPIKGHTEVKDKAVAATCTATGLTEGSHCSVCNAVIKAQTVVPAKGHTEVKDKAVAATCTATGLTEGSHCSVCNAVIKAQTVVPVKGHTEVKDKAVAATCTATGLTEGSHCSVCNAVIKAQTVVPAKGHTKGNWITDKKATVNAAGSKHKECTECGKVLETATIKQLKCSKPSLKKIENTASGVKITWGKVTGADSYVVYRKTGSGGSYKKIATVKGNSKVTYTDKSAKSGKKYYYNVKAVNETGSSEASKAKSILYLADTTLSTAKSTKSGITLKWKKVAGAEGYQVWRKTGNGSYSKIATVKGNAKVTYTDKKASKGKTYTYKIKAYKGKTTSADSNTKKIKDKY